MTPCKGIATERFDTESTYVVVTSHWPEGTISPLSVTLSAMKLIESVCQFQIPVLNHTKMSKLGHSSTSITISEFEQDRRICPLTALKEYFDHTQSLRNGEQCLFVSYVNLTMGEECG